MELTLADHYYFKAADDYPYNLESVSENLNYALSYDPEHTQALCLMGRLFMYKLKDYGMAKTYFQKTLISDMDYPDTYRYLSLLYIWTGDYESADTLIKRAFKIKGTDPSHILYLQALMYECQGDWSSAKAILKKAQLICINSIVIAKIEVAHKRVKCKIKMTKSKKLMLEKQLATIK